MNKFRAVIYLLLFVGGITLLVYFISNFITTKLDQQPQTEATNAAILADPLDQTGQLSTATNENPELPIEVTTTKLASINNIYFDAVGSVKSQVTLSLFPQTSGSIKTVNFQEGDYVNAGDTILELTGNNLAEHPSETQLKVARQTLANAQDSYKALQKTSNESLKTASLQLQSAVSQASAIAYDLGVIEQNKAGLEDTLNILQNSLFNTQQKNQRDDAYGKNNIDHLIYDLNQAQSDRGQIQLQLDNLNSQGETLNSDSTVNPEQIAAFKAEQAKLQANLSAQNKAIDALYDGINKSKYSLNTAENGAALSINQIESQIASSQNQARVLDLNLASAKTKLGYTGDSSDALQLAQQGYQSTRVQLQTALDNAANQIKLAQLNVDLAKNSAGALQIKAPFSGILTSLDLVPGQSVSPQAMVAEIIDPRAFELELGIDASTADRITTAAPAEIILGGHQIDVPIKSISPKVDEKTKLVKVTLGLPNIFFKINQSLSAKLPLASGNIGGGHIYLPLDAVTIGSESQFVYVNDHGKAKQVVVQTGAIAGDQIAILSGLDHQAEVILSGAKSLTAGQSITVLN